MIGFVVRRSPLPGHGIEKLTDGKWTQGEFPFLQLPDNRGASLLGGKIENAPAAVEEHVSGGTLPFLNELFTRASPRHHGKSLPRKVDESSVEVKRQKEMRAPKASLVVHVHEPKHSVLLSVEGLPSGDLLFRYGRVLQLKDNAGLSADISPMSFARPSISQGDLTGFNRELILPSQMP